MQQTQSPTTGPTASDLAAFSLCVCGFEQLTTPHLYAILQARTQVFVVEQHCIYQDMDGLDSHCQHLQCFSADQHLAGYCRIIPPTHSASGHPCIGRVLVSPSYRGQGLARQLMTVAIEYCHSHFPKQSIHISAQMYLQDFYRSLGFVIQSDAYLLDNIWHMDMLLHNIQ